MTNKIKRDGARWDIFLYHVILFVCIHLLFVRLFGLVPLSELGSVDYKEYIKDNYLNHGVNIYKNSMANTISTIWKTILIIHLIVELIETIFPKKIKVGTEGKKELVAKEISDKKEEGRASRAWIYLIIAGSLEIIWASALKMDMLAGPFIIVLIISFDLLIKSVKGLGVGTSYAVFTGIGVVGMVVVDNVLFQETISLLKGLLVVLLVVFIIGLKITSNEQEDMK
ncbi:DMT family transporter [Ornithinibacillus bavariensis]|uniref:DMT family transporter n=1 Tax=Ornithinibacillus bavariensis TaxID=545502 RepID=UPI003D1C2210